MNPFAKLFMLVIGGVLAGCASTVSLPPASPVSGTPEENWAKVLRTHVNDKGQVDFLAVSKDMAPLSAYVNYIANTQPLTDSATFPTAGARLAHYINAYNAMAMYAVIALDIPKTNAGLRKVGFFYLKKYQLDGEVQSLYAYEEKIRNLGDPRVHFALNCMSVGCPILPQTPFKAEGLQAYLDQLTREFFADPTKLRVDPKAKTVYLSEILKFYTDEFLLEASSLIDYVNRYVDEKIPTDYEVEFIPYDWTINQS